MTLGNVIVLEKKQTSFKVIRFDPLAPVKITALLLPVERKMPHFISYNEYLEPIYKKLSSTFIKAFRNNDFG